MAQGADFEKQRAVAADGLREGDPGGLKMRKFDFHPGGRVVFGEGALEQLGALAQELGGERILLVTDPGLVRAGLVEKAQHALHKTSSTVVVFEGVEENPTSRHVEEGTAFARAQGPIDLIVGLGGGSAMDCAKGINFLLTNGGVMEDYWGMDRATQPMLPSMGVPTTAGTGSEAQSFALIAQEKTHQKMACGDQKARFRTVVLDPDLLGSAPPQVVAAAGIDAISHALESYVTTKRNPLSQMYGREAWRLLEQGFAPLVDDPEHPQARGQMLWGAHLAGAAIEASMLGAAHACANPLTACYGVVHGVAVGLMLPHVIRFNSQAEEPLYAGLLPQSEGDCGARLAARVEQLKQLAGLPERLRECSITEENLSALAGAAAAQWTGKFNPRPVGEMELLQLYEAAY